MTGHKKPRFSCKTHLQQSAEEPLCTYGAMQLIADRFYLRAQCTKTAAYWQLKLLCSERSIECIGYRGFCRYLRKCEEALRQRRPHDKHPLFLRFARKPRVE